MDAAGISERLDLLEVLGRTWKRRGEGGGRAGEEEEQYLGLVLGE